MNHELTIREHNQQAHIDIEQDIQTKKDGVFTFVIRVNNGNIVDYVVNEYVDARKYLSLTKVIVQEFIVTQHTRERGTIDPLRNNNGNSGDKEWGS